MNLKRLSMRGKSECVTASGSSKKKNVEVKRSVAD